MALKVDIFGKNLEVTERIADYVTKKVSKLDRYLNNIDDVRVDLDFIKSARNAADRQVAQITIRGRGFILRTEERADDVYAALDASLDKMQRQIERFKGKRPHGRGDGTPASEVIPNPQEPMEPDYTPPISRRKEFLLSPMDELEAVEQMSLLAHENFFIFYNIASNSINVLYKRSDGTLGLIEPKIG